MTVVIHISNRQRRLALVRDGVAALARWVLEQEGRREGELSLLFTNDHRIRELNREYLDRNRPTDVLAFPQDGSGPLLGDVVISTERVLRQAPQYRQSVHDELALCLIHGILHLTGWRDHPAAARKEMGKREKALLRSWRRKKLWSLTK